MLGVAEDGLWSAGTRVSFKSQFIVDNKEYKHGITNNVIFFSRSTPLCSPLFSVQFLIPHYLMTPLTNYNSGFHLFYGWAPKTFHFLVLQNSFFYSLATLIYSLAIACYLLSFFSHSLTDSLHKPFSCVLSIILKNGYSPQYEKHFFPT